MQRWQYPIHNGTLNSLTLKADIIFKCGILKSNSRVSTAIKNKEFSEFNIFKGSVCEK